MEKSAGSDWLFVKRGADSVHAGAEPKGGIWRAVRQKLALCAQQGCGWVLFRDVMGGVVVAVLPAGVVVLDVGVLKHGLGETSITELAQETTLLAVTVGFLLYAWRHPWARGFSVLVAGAMGCMLIRELDAWLDWVWHGFWFWPALCTAVGTVWYVWRRERGTVMTPLKAFVGTAGYYWMLFGLMVVFVFSQVFGSGNVVWKLVLAGGYSHLMKTALQEGLELFGYLLVGVGSLLFLRSERPAPQRA